MAVQTTIGLRDKLTPVGVLHFGPANGARLPIIHVDGRRRYQALTAYGAAMTDTSAWLLYDHLSPTVRARVMQRLFGPSGLRLNLVRVPMGGSDFTVGGTGYSYDDVAAGQTDPTPAGFSIAHDAPYIIPALQEMLAVNPRIELFSNPWSPPAWMKVSDQFGASPLRPGQEGPLAAYFVKYLQAYAALGIHISDLSPENEPTSGAPFPAMQMPAVQEADFVQNDLRPALSAAGLTPAIWGADGADLNYTTALEQSSAAGLFAGMAWHCYGGGDMMMGADHAAYPNVTNILSECSPGVVPYSVSETFIDAVRSWASKVELWNIALDPAGGPVQAPNKGCSGCTALVRVDENTGRATYTRNYYEFAQVSRFVSPGAVRIYSDRFVRDFGPSPWGVTPGVDNVAFVNPNGSHILVACNNDRIRPQRFAVSWHGKQFAYTLPAGATVSFRWGG